MSDETTHFAHFGDSEQTFFLPMSRVIAAEREMDGSIFELFFALGENIGSAGEQFVIAGPSPARLKQCHAVIRNALIGGGKTEKDARDLVETYAYPARAAIYDIALAWSILRAVIYGVQVKKKDEAEPLEPSLSEKAP